MERPGYFPIRQAAIWAGVSSRTMKRWIAGGLATYQAGPKTKVLIRPTDIDQLLTRNQVPQVDINALVNETLKDMEEDRNRQEVT